MIITCEACGTSFKIKSSLIKETGSTVKCSKCQQVFIAYPPYVEPEKPTELVSEAANNDEFDEDAFEKALDKAFEDDFDSEPIKSAEIPSEIYEAIDDEFGEINDEKDMTSDMADAAEFEKETEALFDKLEEDAYTTQEINLADLKAGDITQEIMASDIESADGEEEAYGADEIAFEDIEGEEEESDEIAFEDIEGEEEEAEDILDLDALESGEEFESFGIEETTAESDEIENQKR